MESARRSSPGRRASSCRPRTRTGRRRCPPGWFGGFGALLQQEIVDIGGASNIGALSPAICPACPTGSDADDALTQEQLFVRMDLMRAQGITDESGFTFFEIAQGPQGNAALGERYFEVSYTSAPARSAGLPDMRVLCDWETRFINTKRRFISSLSSRCPPPPPSLSVLLQKRRNEEAGLRRLKLLLATALAVVLRLLTQLVGDAALEQARVLLRRRRG
jgi:hypothetical protein